jgi:hypothetical protein
LEYHIYLISNNAFPTWVYHSKLSSFHSRFKVCILEFSYLSYSQQFICHLNFHSTIYKVLKLEALKFRGCNLVFIDLFCFRKYHLLSIPSLRFANLSFHICLVSNIYLPFESFTLKSMSFHICFVSKNLSTTWVW